MANATVSIPHTPLRVRGLLTRVMRRLIAARIERGTIEALSRLSNRELADIGLTRGEIGGIARAHADEYLAGR
jgi:uncharacterized protein YjiS (DUF1127 family)